MSTPLAIRNQLAAENSSAQLIQLHLRALDLLLSYLKVTGGEPQMPLLEYFHKVAQLHDEAGLNTPAFTELKLQHVIDLYTTLQNLFQSDVQNVVMKQFRVKLQVRPPTQTYKQTRSDSLFLLFSLEAYQQVYSKNISKN